MTCPFRSAESLFRLNHYLPDQIHILKTMTSILDTPSLHRAWNYKGESQAWWH